MIRTVLLSMWIGAILFFAIAIAPNVFAVLTPHEGGRALAGDIVARALTALHYLGLTCGVLFLLFGIRRMDRKASWLVIAMLVLTCVSQFGISRRMHAIRAAVVFDRLEATDPRRAEFNRLHRLSTSTEGAILLLGVTALLFESTTKAKRR